MNRQRVYIPLYTDVTQKNVMVAGCGEEALGAVRYLNGYTEHLTLLTCGEEESVPAESRPAESVPAESRPAQNRPEESVPAESRPEESGPAESRPAQNRPEESGPAAGGAVKESIEEAVKEAAPGADVRCKPYERRDLYGMDYVLCYVKDPAVRDDISVTCRTLGIRVQMSRDPARSDFFLGDALPEDPMQ